MNVLALLLLAAGFADQPADRPDDAHIARHIEQLDADTFELREKAERSLLEIGLPALKLLERARKSESAEVRSRARRIHAKIQLEYFEASFRKLVDVKRDQEIDLERAMFLMALALDSSVREEEIDQQLDDLAKAVQKKLPVKAAAADPRDVVAAFRDVLFKQQGFTGNQADYDNPANSSIANVLKEKKGLPILLSHVVVAVARRLDVPMVGVPIPSRYMVKYDGSRAPDRFAKQDIVICPFEDFQEKSPDELAKFLADRGFEFDPREHLQPSTHHATVVRMLVNLVNDLRQKGNDAQAERIEKYRQIVLQQTFGEVLPP